MPKAASFPGHAGGDLHSGTHHLAHRGAGAGSVRVNLHGGQHLMKYCFRGCINGLSGRSEDTIRQKFGDFGSVTYWKGGCEDDQALLREASAATSRSPPGPHEVFWAHAARRWRPRRRLALVIAIRSEAGICEQAVNGCR